MNYDNMLGNLGDGSDVSIWARILGSKCTNLHIKYFEMPLYEV